MNRIPANSPFDLNFGTRSNENIQETTSKDKLEESIANSNKIDISNKENEFAASSDHQRRGTERQITEERIEEEEEEKEQRKEKRLNKGYRMPLSDQSLNLEMLSSQKQVSFPKYASKECCKKVHLEAKTDEFLKANRDLKKLNLSDKASKKEKLTREEKFQLKKPQLIADLEKKKIDYIKCIGGGLHGNVILIKDHKRFFQAMKLYDLNDENTYRREVSVLTKKKIGKRAIKAYDRYKLTDYYAIVIKLGVGTLLTFREFINHKDYQIKITEADLISIFIQINSAYEQMREFHLYHRDIKPQNIVLYEDDLELNLIDFGLSTLHDSNLSGRSGTRGFIPNYVYCRSGNLTRRDLFNSDLYAIGITILTLALPDFWPKQNDKKRVEEALGQISHFKTLHPIIQHLLFPTPDTRRVSKKLIEENLANSDLSHFKQKFMQYIKDQSVAAEEKMKGYKSQLRDNFDELVWTKDSKKRELSSKKIKEDLKFYQEDKNREGELYCYQTIIINYRDTKEWSHACQEVLKALQEDKFEFHFLVYLMLACYKCQKHDLQGASQKLKEGMNRSYNIFCEQILLKESLRLACSSDFDDQSSNDVYKEANETIERAMLEKFDFYTTEWLSENLPGREKLLKPEPLAHIDITRLHLFTCLGPNLQKASIKSLLLDFFSLKCYKKAKDFIFIIKKVKNSSVIENAKHFTHNFHLRRRSFLVCSPYYEFLITLLNFKDLLSFSSLPSIPIKLKNLLQEIESLESLERELYTSVRKDSIAALCKIYNFNEILFTMIGLTLIPIDDDDTLKEIDTTRQDSGSLRLSKDNLITSFEQNSISPDKGTFFKENIPNIPKSTNSRGIDELSKVQKQLFNERREFTSRFSYPIEFEANWSAVKSYFDPSKEQTIPTLQKIIKTLFNDSYPPKPNEDSFKMKTSNRVLLNEIIDIDQQKYLINSLSLKMTEKRRLCTSHLRFKGNMELEEAKFRHLSNTTFAGFSDSLYGLNLIKLTLSFKHLKKFSKERIQNVMEAISSQKLLKYLEVNYQKTTMGNFIIETLVKSVKDHTELEELHLLFSKCSNISDGTLNTMIDFLKTFHPLQNMTMQLGYSDDIDLKYLDRFKIEFEKLFPNYGFERIEFFNNDEDERET